MRICVNVDDKLGADIESAAEKLKIKKSDWLRMVCKEFISPSQPDKTSEKIAEESSTKSSESGYEEINAELNEEISRLKHEIESQKELHDTYSRLISEKDQRIEDMKESISRIEAMSITTTDQIASSKDERINDLTNMIEHLQAQAAAHSVALQSAVRPALENGNNTEKKSDKPETDSTIMNLKEKWKFWK